MKKESKIKCQNNLDPSDFPTGMDPQKISFYLRRNNWHRHTPARLSGIDTRDFESELAAFYQIAVESRNAGMKYDESTSNHISDVGKWVKGSSKPWLLLSGPNGNGKTTMLTAIHHYVKNSVYVTALDLESKAQNQEGLSYYYSCATLIIDDVGKESDHLIVYGTPVPVVANILRRRYARNLVTIMSSNYTVEELAQRYGKDIADRFSECLYTIAFTNKSYR